MANTKLTKRKDGENSGEVKSSSDSEPELPQNQGNGDLVDDLSHVHSRCDDLMAKLKALNQAAQDMLAVSAVADTSPFISPIFTPVQMEVNVNVIDDGEAAPSQERNEGGELGDVVAVADTVSDNLISYLMGGLVDNSVAVETNPVLIEVPESEMVQLVEAVIIDKA